MKMRYFFLHHVVFLLKECADSTFDGDVEMSSQAYGMIQGTSLSFVSRHMLAVKRHNELFTSVEQVVVCHISNVGKHLVKKLHSMANETEKSSVKSASRSVQNSSGSL